MKILKNKNKNSICTEVPKIAILPKKFKDFFLKQLFVRLLLIKKFGDWPQEKNLYYKAQKVSVDLCDIRVPPNK